MPLLLRRKLLSVKNRLLSMSRWDWLKNGAFVSVGLWMLAGLHYAFWRLLGYLNTIELIGPLLIWKMTAMAMLTTFSMVVLSSLIISLTTLFYAADLRYLIRSPLSMRQVFLDKSVEVVFFSSWMIALALFPYMLALGRVKGFGWDFYAVFLGLLLPCLVIAATCGMAFTLALMYCFPSSRTRDAVWVLSSLSLAIFYALIRFSQPERLVRPDMLKLVAEYLHYLQAPTAPYAPSWWMTQGLDAYVGGRLDVFWSRAAWLWGGCAIAYAAVTALAVRAYAAGYSGAQESRRMLRGVHVPLPVESRLAQAVSASRALGAFLWKERLLFFRDVKHWSQILLIGALVAVYLFSVSRLPLDSPDLKSLVCFLNIGAAGFVLAALCLRFTFPAISLEGRSYWVARSAPVTTRDLMRQKFLFSVVPTLVIATALVAATNYLLKADAFIAGLSLGTIWLAAWTLCGMGVGLGAFFPRFSVENIHQIESSAGGFAYMACALGYVALTLGAEAIPVQMHFHEHLGRVNAWDWRWAAISALILAILNLAAFLIPWSLGRRRLEAYEAD